MGALVGALLVAACNGAPVATTSAPTPSPSPAVVVPTPSAGAPAVTVPPSTAPSAAGSIAGTWQGTWTSKAYPGLTGHFTLIFTQQGSTLSGSISITGSGCISDATITGVINGSQLTFGVVQGAETVSYTGTWSGASMSGTWVISQGSGGACTTDSGDWAATR